MAFNKSEIVAAIDGLIKKFDLNVDNGDCLDLAVGVTLVCRSLRVPHTIQILQRFVDGERDAVIHAVCSSEEGPIGASQSDMNDLVEHQTYLEEDDRFRSESASYHGDEDIAEEFANRYYEILELDGAGEEAELFSFLAAEFSSSTKNNRREPLFNEERAKKYASEALRSIGLQPQPTKGKVKFASP